MVELKLKCGFLITKTYSLFPELFLDEKVPTSGHFRVRRNWFTVHAEASRSTQPYRTGLLMTCYI